MKKFRFLKNNNDDFVDYSNTYHLEIIGNTQCIVDGLKGIVEYNKDKITINLGKNLITFEGCDLRIESFSHEGAIVQGNIMSMEFSQYD